MKRIFLALIVLGAAAFAQAPSVILSAGGSGTFTALTGDATSTATGGATTVVKINGTSFAGTSGHIVSFGAANIPADSGVVAANVLAVSAPAAHSVLLGAGTQAPGTAGPNAATTYPLFSAGSSADPAFRAIAAADIPSALRAHTIVGGFNGNVIPPCATLQFEVDLLDIQ